MTAEVAQTIFWYVLSGTVASIAITFILKVSLHMKFDVNEYLRERRKIQRHKRDTILRNKCPHARLDQTGIATLISRDGRCEQCGHVFHTIPLEATSEYWKGEGKAEELDRRQKDFIKAAKKFGLMPD